MTVYADIADLDEDKRIEMIGTAVMNGPRSSTDKPVMAAFGVEDDAKADRYIEKLQNKQPGIRVYRSLLRPCTGYRHCAGRNAIEMTSLSQTALEFVCECL